MLLFSPCRWYNDQGSSCTDDGVNTGAAKAEMKHDTEHVKQEYATKAYDDAW